jgi:EmrB/QacA subfamily drug resistance transporter
MPTFDSPVAPGRPRQLLTVALMLAMAVVALEGTVVTTAMPSVVGQLQGLTLYPWVFSIYLLTSTTTVPIYGKLADLYGRRPVFLLGLALFLAGTFLCGASGTMVHLVIFRAIQGLGAGAVQPLVFTVFGDIYDLEERAKVQPLTATIWGVLSLAGPAAGALITIALSWRWVFWLNVPVCLLAMLLITLFLKERVTRHEVAIDYAGAATLTIGLILVLLAVSESGSGLPWESAQGLALLVAGAVTLAAFALVERRAADPVLPFEAFVLRPVAISIVGNLFLGIANYGLVTYVPLYAQGVRGESAAGASAVLTPLMIGWSASALIAGRVFLRLGFRRTALLGTTLVVLGHAPLLLATLDTPLLWIGAPMGVTGIGLGFISTTFLLTPQSAVAWRLRGAVTASVQFARTIVGAVGVAVLGAVLNARLAATELPRDGQSLDQLVSALVSPATRAELPASVVRDLSAAMADGLHRVYVVLTILAVLGLLQVLAFARREDAPEAATLATTVVEPA